MRFDRLKGLFKQKQSSLRNRGLWASEGFPPQE